MILLKSLFIKEKNDKLNHSISLNLKDEDSKDKIILPIDKPEEFSHKVTKFLLNLVDKVLLIDLLSKKNSRMNNYLEIIIYIFYSNIDIFIVLAFIINQCVDASIFSLVFPLSYFLYGSIEYPFPSRIYWKYMILYSIIILSLKLIYQLPFFCGYPFLSIFNVFTETHCEVFNLTDIEIVESLAYIIGLRKYNGDYSYPKNGGILRGIIWDITIIILLFIQRNLLKAKGIWNFISIDNDYTKTPFFDFHYKNKYYTNLN